MDHNWGKEIYDYKNTVVRDIVTPIFLITGIGMDCNKFSIQLELKKQMNEKKFQNHCITYNPLGFVYDMDVIKYPDKILFPELIYSINDHIKTTEENFIGDYEAIIINVAGSMFPLNRVNTNNFGMLYHAYINALSIDYVIICVNSIINLSSLEKEIKKLNLIGIFNISLVVSDLTYNTNFLEDPNGIIIYWEDIEVKNKYIEECKNYFKDISVYSYNDVKEGKLLSNIINIMT